MNRYRLSRDGWVSVAVFVGALAMRVLFRSRYAYHWDSAQLALAVEQYDLRAGLPHAPGFFLYVLLGRLAAAVTGDAHAGLVWLSVVAGALLPALGYRLGTALGGQAVGAVTATMLASSVLTWFHSCVALTTMVDSVLVLATALVAWRTATVGSWTGPVAMGLLLAAVAGVRGQTVPGLLPLWLYALARVRSGRWARLALGLATAAVAGAAWWVPLAASCGGPSGYLEVLAAKRAGDARYLWWQAGPSALWSNLYVTAGALVLGLGLAGAMAVVEWWRAPAIPRGPAARFLWWWIVPMVLMGTVGLYTFLPGHTLCYFPAVALAAAFGVARLVSRWRGSLAVVLGLIAVSNGALFLTNWDLPQLRMNAAEIREHDAALERLWAQIRARYRPQEVVIAHHHQWFLWGLRHFQYHLPEYESWLVRRDPSMVAPWNQRLWRTRGRQVEFVEALEAGGRAVLWYEPPATLTVTNQSRWMVRE